jgi:dTDP-4-dehydrorhamnose reductase
MTKKTILIFGISSFVGSNLAEFFKNDYRVVGTYFKNPVSIPGVCTVPCDVLVRDEIQMALYTFKPDYAIYAIGISSLLNCADAPELGDALNAGGLFNVAEFCQRYKAQIIYISSAYVFGGSRKSYMEADVPDANTLFGRTKASAEFFLQRTSLNYLIFRCCNLYGRSITPRQISWFEKLQHSIAKNTKVPCDNYIYCGFIDVFYLAAVIKFCIEKTTLNRLFQVSSLDHYTFYEFAKSYCSIFGESESNLEKVHWPFPLLESAKKNNVSDEHFYKMDVSNLEGYINVRLPTIDESILFTLRRMDGMKKTSGSRKKGDDVTFI